MALGYFSGDFLHTSSPFHSGTGALSYNLNAGNELYDATVTHPLYDGTITTQSSFIRPPVQSIADKQFKELVGETYRYDRLYRLRSVYFGPYQYAPPDNQSKPKWYMDGDYESAYKYDANGNFTYLRRWGRLAGPPYNVLSVNKKMDEFGEYVYTSGTNRLESFTESSYMTPFFTDDIDAEYMQAGNYVYDASGRVITDKMEGVKPKWDIYDKVVEVVNNNGPLSSGESTPNASSKKIRYRYDAAGQRVQRLVFNFNATNGDFESEPALVQSYVYGVGGELLGVYEQKYVGGELQEDAELKEWPMYGAGRLGLAQPVGTVNHLGTLLSATDKYDRPVDKKRYELSDHLGNVRAVVSDLKLDDSDGSFVPDLKAYYNYYAYGMLHPNRWWEAESYRFGFNGVEKENDVTVKGGIAMADFRMYDARVGRWWGVDKIVKVHESPYAAFANNPINFADPSGLDTEPSPLEPGKTNFWEDIGNAVSSGINAIGSGISSIGSAISDIGNGLSELFTSDQVNISRRGSDGDDGPIESPDVSWWDTPMSQKNILGWTVNHDPFIYAKTGLIYTVPPSTPLETAQQTAIVGTPIVAGLMGSYWSQLLLTWAIGNPLGAQDVMEEIGYGVGGMQRPTSSVVPLQTSAILEEGIENVAKPGGSAYDGIRAASEFLQEQRVPREFRKQILQSFEVETISLQVADNATYGLRFYDDKNAYARGRYLFPSFDNLINRIGLALPYKWNHMTHIIQWQIQPGTIYIYGRAASQGGLHTGGSF
jgi:RHS repeat-associated protein